MEKLTLEAFEGIGKIATKKFYRYKIVSKGAAEDVYKIIGSAKYSLTSRNKFKLVVSKHDVLYTLEKFEDIITNSMEILFDGEEILDIENNTDVYSEVLIYHINENLKKVLVFDKYKKYYTKNNDEILSNTVLTREKKEAFIRSDKGFDLKRKFKVRPSVKKSGEVILYVSCSADFSTKQNIYNLMKAGEDIIGLDVKNIWSNIKQSGKVIEILNLKITDKMAFGESLVDYYKNKNQAYRVKDFTQEDLNSNVVRVQSKKKTFDYIPHALTPIITREYLAKKDPSFSNRIEKLIKMDMAYRYEVLKSFINDIGIIEEFEISFTTDYYESVECMGYKSGQLKEPVLVAKKGVLKNKMNVFSTGFYHIPNKIVRFGVLYPEGCEESSKKTMRAIYDFTTLGKYNGEENKFVANELMNIKFNPKECIFESYKLGDITEYKKAVLKVKKYKEVELIIAVVPNINDEVENSYNPFKRTLAELNIPSQMISLKTAEMFKKSVGNTGLYYLHNIALGILGKIGGIPFVLKDAKGNVDCFIGLDVGTREKGIHYPACSVVFDGQGKLINYYKPTIPQSGEIIQTKILQEIFDEVLIGYEEKNGSYPKNIVIHRDGFSREDLEWYENYFSKKGIKFNIIEVRKNTPLKIARKNGDRVSNPKKGDYILAGGKAYLVTTDIDEKLGSAKPLKIEKTYGDLDMITILEQIYALSQIHVGSIKSLRLPITTGYADKLCKMVEFIPQGVLDNRLFFL